MSVFGSLFSCFYSFLISKIVLHPLRCYTPYKILTYMEIYVTQIAKSVTRLSLRVTEIGA